MLNILKLNDLVDGLVFCDYTIPEFSCKPEAAYYKMVRPWSNWLSKCRLTQSTQAMKQANVTDPSKCYFVDDNRGNIDGALAQGWGKCVHFCEKGLESMEGGITKQIGDEPLDPTKANGNSIVEVSNLMQLREIWSEIFRH